MLGFAVGVFGLAFLGYCVYFDNKRRSDPNFKKKLRERKCALPIKSSPLSFFNLNYNYSLSQSSYLNLILLNFS